MNATLTRPTAHKPATRADHDAAPAAARPAAKESPALPIAFNPLSAAHRLIRDETPPTPACFDSREDWMAYLLRAHESGARIVRREDIGKWRGERRTRFLLALPIEQHCLDCRIGDEYQLRMVREGRCHPAFDLDNHPSRRPTMTTTATMRFKSPDPERPLHLAVTSGHSCVIGTDWTEIDKRFWGLAVQRGALVEGDADSEVTQILQMRAVFEQLHPDGFDKKHVKDLRRNMMSARDFDLQYYEGASVAAMSAGA